MTVTAASALPHFQSRLALALLKDNNKTFNHKPIAAFPEPVGSGLIEGFTSSGSHSAARSNFQSRLALALLKVCGRDEFGLRVDEISRAGWLWPY